MSTTKVLLASLLGALAVQAQECEHTKVAVL